MRAEALAAVTADLKRRPSARPQQQIILSRSSCLNPPSAYAPPSPMNCLSALRAALLVAAACSAPLIRAADADRDDAPAPSTGRIKNIGSRQAAPEVAAASDEAAQAIKRMKVPDGLEITLWAAEPMLANPVAFNFDEKGRIFVAETYRYRTSVLDIRDYMWFLEDDLSSRTIDQRTQLVRRRRFGAEGEKELGIEGEVLRLLEDTNGDGVADRSHVYADGFNSPLDGIASGVLARRGEVWFTNIPSVWKFTGKTKADTRTEISRGYGVRFNYTGHDLHGLIMGPDGRLYFSNGDRGATVKTKEGGVISVPDEGAVFRCLPGRLANGAGRDRPAQPAVARVQRIWRPAHRRQRLRPGRRGTPRARRRGWRQRLAHRLPVRAAAESRPVEQRAALASAARRSSGVPSSADL
jgi:hypothetical protein